MNCLSNAFVHGNRRWICWLWTIIVAMSSTQARAGYADYVLSLNPTAYWRLGESAFDSGRRAVDSSGNGNHGTYHNRVPASALGHFGALNPADSDYAIHDPNGLTTVSLPGSIFFTGSQPFTISLWCYPVNAGGFWQSLFGLGYPAHNSGISLGTRLLTGGIGIHLARFFNNFHYSPTILEYDRWHHVALRFDGTANWDLFINGQLDSSAFQYLSVGSTEAWLGEFFGWETAYSYPFHGGLDEAAYFNFTLSDEAIVGLSDIYSTIIPEPQTVGLLLSLSILFLMNRGQSRGC